MADVDTIVRDVLKASMTTDVLPSADYFVKTWFDGPFEQYGSLEAPCAAVYLEEAPARNYVFVGEDTETNLVIVEFVQRSLRKQAFSGESEKQTVAPGYTRLKAMLNRASLALRADPTFGVQVVTSSIMPGGTVWGVVPQDTGVLRRVQMRVLVKQRKLWGA